MAKIFSQLEKAQLENTTSDTASHPKGMITYRTDLNQAKVSNGTAYKLLIDEDSSQTLSNKTYASPITSGAITSAQTTTPASPSAGSNKFYFKADDKLYTLNSAGTETLVGSGGGGGVKNLITNGNADDTSSSIFIPYADAAATRPVDGTGGSPTVTTSVTSTVPLDGVKSYLLTKPASNVQGQGWAVPFTVDPAYRAKSLKISADFIVNSGTFVAGSNGASPTDGDLIWTVYDVTNSVIIEPSNIKMFSQSSTISDKFEATFQTSATGASYRLIAHVASTSALAFELKVDNITVSPSNYVYGSPITDMQPWPITPTGSWTGGNATYTGKYSRNGDRMSGQLDIELTGAPTGTTLTLNMLPFVIDTAKLVQSSNLVIGDIAYRSAGNYYHGKVLATSSTTLRCIQLTSPTTSAVVMGTDITATSPGTFTTGDFVRITFRDVPIVGWSSSVQMSDSYDSRLISTRIYKNGTQTYSTLTKLTSFTVDSDKTGMWDATNNRFNILSPGDYQLFSNLYSTAATTANQQLAYKVNGGTTMYYGNAPNTSGAINASMGGSDIIPGLKAGDYVEIYGYSDASVTVQSGITASRFSLSRIASPQTISATETIVASYGVASGQTLTAAAIIKGDTKVVDTHGAYNTSTGVYTVPAAGLYRISHTFFSITATSAWNVQIRKNSSAVTSTDTIPQYSGGTSIVNNRSMNAPLTPYIGFFNADDTIDFYNSSAIATGNLYASSAANYFTIERIK